MRALILAAGLGTRMAPLSGLRAKPAMPVRGVPVVGALLALLRHHGVTEAAINLHHRPDSLRRAVARFLPPGLEVRFSEEPERPLGTGGALRRVASFLRESDPALVIAGDMLLDLDLRQLVARHRERGDLATLALRADSREAVFGTIGIAEEGRVRRIGRRFDMGGETAAGVFVSVRVLAPRAFDALPEREVFEDLRDWLAPALAAGARDVRGELLAPGACAWEPIGTPSEYLRANLRPPSLSYLDLDAAGRAAGARLEKDLVLGAGAVLEPGAALERAVVWEDERVPSGLRAREGVFASGRFHPAPLEEERCA